MLTLLVVGLLAAAPMPATPGTEAAIRALADRYREHLVERRPDLAWRWGVPGTRPRLPWFSASALRRDAARVDSLHAAVLALDSAGLDLEYAARRRMLLLRTTDERVQLAALTHEPLAWSALVTDLVHAQLARPGAKPCDHARRLLPVLAASPELWRSASIVLGAPMPSPARRDSLAAAARVLRERLPAAVGGCREPQTLAAFARADTAALAALARFAGFVLGDTLRGPAPRASRRAALP
jgi:hypothetical protein